MLPRKLPIVFVMAAGLLLAGCFDRFPQLAFFPHSQFVTITDVALRSGQDDESSIVAHVPKGTIVVPIGQMGSEANATWRVNTPEGIGWVYTRYLASLHQADDD
jgi:uncharacterized protein YraI